MLKRAIGRGGLKVPELSLGTAPIGNLLKAVSSDDAWQTVQEAWSQGVRYFDTAPHYGLGLAERRLGEALVGQDRNSFVASSKVGRLLEPTRDYPGENDLADGFLVPKDYVRNYDYSADGIKRSIEESLERLQMDYLDIVYVHDPDDHYEQALNGAFPALQSLRDQGVIKSFGSGMNQSQMLAEFVKRTELDVVMLAGRYTLLDQTSLDDLLPLAEENDVSIVAAGVFNSGLLSKNRPAADATYDYAQAPSALIAKANAIADVCEEFGVNLPAVAARFPFGHSTIANVCLGARSAEQVKRNCSLLEVEVPSGLWQELASKGLIDPRSVEVFLGD